MPPTALDVKAALGYLERAKRGTTRSDHRGEEPRRRRTLYGDDAGFPEAAEAVAAH